MEIKQIKDIFAVRKVNENYVAHLVEVFQREGYQAAYPVSITEDGILWDGIHRLEAAKRLGWTEIPHIIETPDNLRKAAHARNAAAADALPETFVDHAEEIWRMTGDGKGLEQIKDEMGWSLSKVKQYSALQGICKDAWDVVVTDVTDSVTAGNGRDSKETENAVTFSENLLRSILPLTPDHQCQLVEALVTKDKDARIDKGKFVKQATAYKARDKAADYVFSKIAHLGNEYLESALKAVDSGAYDAEWTEKKNGKESDCTKTDKLIQAQIDAFEEKNNILLIHGDFYKEVKKIESESIDAIITDPPYNISQDRIYRLASQADWNKNFGEWDNQTHDDMEFIACIDCWSKEFFRVLKPGKSGFMFVGERFMNIAQSIFDEAGFEIKGTLFWCRTNPGVSVTKADFMPAMDMAIQFVKPGATRLFNYPGDPDGVNYVSLPICGGKERLKDKNGNTLHPTQKPESIIEHMMKTITDIGDRVFDGFMGVGTVPAVAKKLQRKCVGIESDKAFHEAAQRRIL